MRMQLKSFIPHHIFTKGGGNSCLGELLGKIYTKNGKSMLGKVFRHGFVVCYVRL